MVIVESAGISDVGKKRNQNEDSLFFDNSLGLYIVADGMGGHQAGEVASRLVVETMRDCIHKFQENGHSAELTHTDETLSIEANQLLSSIRRSNEIVHKTSQSSESYRGMGSTVSAVYFTDNTLIAANVGDSPIYLIRNRKIRLFSMLHTVFAEQSARDPEYADMLGTEFKHVLTRAMGVDESVQAYIHEIPFFKNDIIVISSDGLSDKAAPEEILQIVEKNSSGKACQLLVDLANERGGDDNITIIVLKIKKAPKTQHNLMGLIFEKFKKLFKLQPLK